VKVVDNMKKRIIKEDQFNISKWSGGTTIETAIFPEKSQYLERDFIWRLSSATVEIEESSFTKLPDYDRVLMVLDGNVVLAFGDERSASLSQYQHDSFDGAIKTKCFGTMTDYNLMFRKGCEGSLEFIEAKQEASVLQQSYNEELSDSSYGIYCVDGYVIVSVCGETSMVKKGEQMVIDFEDDENKSVTIMGDGKCVAAEVLYKKERLTAEVIPEEKATFDDFKAAFKLVHGSNKWMKILKENKKSEIWYDEFLQEKLNFLEKKYITFFVWIAGMIISSLVMIFADTSAMVIVMLAWSVLHMLLIAPLIYMKVLPKPINAHIKKISELTEYELGVYASQRGKRENIDKIMRKYREPGDDNYVSYKDRIKNIFK